MKIIEKIKNKLNVKNIIKIFIIILSVGIIGVLGIKYLNYIEIQKANKIKMEKEKKIELYEKERKNIRKENIECILDNELKETEEIIYDFANEDNNYGIYYQDFATGEIIKTNSKKDFTAASTIKVCLAMKVADLMNSGKVNEEGSMRYKSCDFEGGTGSLQNNRDKLSKPIKYKELMRLAIVHSDNIATQMLLREFGQVNKYIYDVSGTTRKSGGNYISAYQQGKILERLYKNPDNNHIYDEIKEWMKNTIFHDRLDRYIPNEIVAHKIGSYGGFVHDTGIVFTNRPYSISVYSQGRGSLGMAGLSRDIYELRIETEQKIKDEKNKCKLDILEKKKEIFEEL